MLHLPDNIKLIRELSNKTQIDFAKLLDIKDRNGNYSSDKIYSYETGKAKPSEIILRRISGYANVSQEDLKNKKLVEVDIKIDRNYKPSAIDAFMAGLDPKNSSSTYEEASTDITQTETELNSGVVLQALIKIVNSNEGLVRSNELLARSNADLSASNKIITETNQRIADKVLSTTTVGAPPQISEAVFSILRNLQELVTDVALGKRFESKQEVNALLNKVNSAPA